jgi:hypothetical protein
MSFRALALRESWLEGDLPLFIELLRAKGF